MVPSFSAVVVIRGVQFFKTFHKRSFQEAAHLIEITASRPLNWIKFLHVFALGLHVLQFSRHYLLLGLTICVSSLGDN